MTPGKYAVPYVPFKTFLAAIEGLEREMPTQLDRSLWPSYSGAIQGQLLGAFGFLGLMDEGNCPTPELRELVLRREGRKALLRRLLERGYGPLVALDLARASPRQFDDAMRQYGVSGATHRKAVSFFLQAARFADLPLSVLLRGRTRGTTVARRKAAADPKPAAAAAPQASRSVRLKSGGTVTVTALVDWFALSAEDRSFVFELIDRLQNYERPGT